MREYIVLLTYDRGVHPVRDVYIDHPDLLGTSLAISSSPDVGWRVERLTGSEGALEELEQVYLDPEICNECIYPHPKCDAKFEFEVLETSSSGRTIYRSTTEESFCSAVSVTAMETLGPGLVFDATHRGPYYEWRILIPENRDLQSFHAALESGIPDGVDLEVRRIGQFEQWHHGTRHRGTELPYEQREALETAVRLGYYEYPRTASLEDIAHELDLPLTTLRYRLRRAESWAIMGAQSPTLLNGYITDADSATA